MWGLLIRDVLDPKHLIFNELIDLNLIINLNYSLKNFIYLKFNKIKSFLKNYEKNIYK